jgi:hypothetical protein
MFKPKNDSADAISLKKWRRQSPDDFRKACDGAYDAYMGSGSGQATARSDSNGESTQEKLLLASVPVSLGAIIGYLLSKLARSDERRRVKASKLSADLSRLDSAIDRLHTKMSVEDVGSDERLAVRHQAIELCNAVRASAKQTDAATTALRELVKASEAGSGQGAEAEARTLKDAGDKVKKAVAELIAEVRKKGD